MTDHRSGDERGARAMTNPDPALTTHHEAEFAVFLATLAPGEEVSTNTVRSRWLPAAQINPRRLGGLIRGAGQAGLITPTGYTTATHEQARGRTVRAWARTSKRVDLTPKETT